VAVRVAADDAAPERLRRGVLPQLGDLPPAGEAVEQRPRDVLAHPPAAVLAQDEELVHVRRLAVAQEGPVARHEGEAGEPAPHADEEDVPARPPDGVVVHVPVAPGLVDVGARHLREVVLVELRQPPDDGPVSRRGGDHLDACGYPVHLVLMLHSPSAGRAAPVRAGVRGREPRAGLLWWERRLIADALAGAAGVACAQAAVWPSGPGVNRRDIYAMRDRGELTRRDLRELFRRPLPAGEAAVEVEVPGAPGPGQAPR
jgi:hypothetical protein